MSHNVWADMGFPDAEEMLSKAGLVVQLTDLISDRRLSMSSAAKQLDLTRSELMAILDGQFQEHSIRQLEVFIETMSGAPRGRLPLPNRLLARI